MNQLITVLGQLQEVLYQTHFANKINLPQIVSVGAQSSGKSSVLEMIIGQDILPRGSGIVTRRPTLVQLFNTTKGTYPYAIFGHKPDLRFTDFEEVRFEIQSEMNQGAGYNKGISTVPIVVKIYSPEVVNLTLIDLPGITKIPVGDQPTDIEKVIKNMIRVYIDNPNSLILAISPANYDLANSDALKLARETDPDGERTIGIITKVDTVDDDEQLFDTITGKVYKLKHGYVGVKCRNQKETEAGLDMKTALRNEGLFFENHSKLSQLKTRMGIPYLTRKLNEYLVEHVKKCLPMIRQKLNGLLAEKEAERKNYGLVFTFNTGSADKSTLLYTIVNRFAKLYSDSINGNIINEEELCGGAKINHLLELFRRNMQQFSPFQDLNDNDLSVAIRNVSGLSSSLVISDKAFEVLVKKQIQKLIKPCFECISMVFNELKTILNSLKIQELDYLFKAREAVLRVATDILGNCLMPSESMLTNIFRIEIGYINTRNPDFIRQREHLVMERNQNQFTQKKEVKPEDDGGFFSFFGGSKEAKKESLLDSALPSKDEIGFIKGLISIYFNIVRKNLIDYVPKTVITLLVNSSCDRIEKELFTTLSTQYRPDDILSVDQGAHDKFRELEQTIASLTKCKVILEEFDRIKL